MQTPSLGIWSNIITQKMEKYIPLQPGSDEDGQIDQTSSLLQHEIDTREGDSAILMQWTHKRRGSLLYVILQGSVLVSTALIFFASGWVLHTPSTTTSSAWSMLGAVASHGLD